MNLYICASLHTPLNNINLDLDLFYVTFNSQGHIATGSLQVEETSAYCTVNHRASASNYQLSNMKRPARDSNRRPQRLEARTLTATPPSPLNNIKGKLQYYVMLNSYLLLYPEYESNKPTHIVGYFNDIELDAKLQL